MKMRPLTDMQRFALRAVEKGAVYRKVRIYGWRKVYQFYAWDSEITSQIRSLYHVHHLIKFRNGIPELRKISTNETGVQI